MCTLFANLYVLLMWGPHMVYMRTPYIFDIYLITCGWLGYNWWAACSWVVSYCCHPYCMSRRQLSGILKYSVEPSGWCYHYNSLSVVNKSTRPSTKYETKSEKYHKMVRCNFARVFKRFKNTPIAILC